MLPDGTKNFQCRITIVIINDSIPSIDSLYTNAYCRQEKRKESSNMNITDLIFQVLNKEKIAFNSTFV